MRQISKEIKIPYQTIWKYLKKYNIKMHRISWKTMITRQLLFELYINQKLSLRKIAVYFKCSLHTIVRYLKKFDIKIRTCQEGCLLLNRGNTNNPMYGKKGINHPAYKHGGIFYCNCGKEKSDYRHKRCSKCYGIWRSKYITRAKCSSWQGGISFEPYSSEWTNKLKESIRKRDNYTCQKCGVTENTHLIIHKKGLSIHHIDYNKKNCKEDNLITLCYRCHAKTNSNRDYWFAYFRYIMKRE